MSHAFWWLPSHRGTVLLVLLVMTVGFSVVLKRQGRPLEEAGASILDYELAWTRADAQAVLAAAPLDAVENLALPGRYY